MFERRMEITADLRLLSPLHVGRGERQRRGDIRDPEDHQPGADLGVWVAQVLTDAAGRPCLPGTTVKGLLRRLLPADQQEALCGSINAQDGSGRIGRLSAYTAKVRCLPAAFGPLPHLDADHGISVQARVRLAPDTGVAEDGKLFHAESVPPGTLFGLRLSLDLGEREGFDQDGALNALAAALQAWRAADGVACGRGQSQGQGRLRLLDETLKAEMIALHANGDLGRDDITADLRERMDTAAAVASPTFWRAFTLNCPGPYVTIDSSHRSLRGKGQELPEEEQQAQIKVLHGGKDTPMVSGSAVLGVLRARARWLHGLCRLRNEKALVEDKAEEIYKRDEALTPVQRLFGITGWRGCLRVAALEVTQAGKLQTFTSVALDRFSGAPLDGALFATETYVGVQLRLVLALDREGSLTTEDRELLADLQKDLETNGLKLGHGTNKGFGWFQVTPLPHGQGGSC